MYIDHDGHIVLWLTMVERQQSLKYRWWSISRWGRERFHLSFAYQGSQLSGYDYLQPVTPTITTDPRPALIGTSLTPIPMMAQGG